MTFLILTLPHESYQMRNAQVCLIKVGRTIDIDDTRSNGTFLFKDRIPFGDYKIDVEKDAVRIFSVNLHYQGVQQTEISLLTLQNPNAIKKVNQAASQPASTRSVTGDVDESRPFDEMSPSRFHALFGIIIPDIDHGHVEDLRIVLRNADVDNEESQKYIQLEFANSSGTFVFPKFLARGNYLVRVLSKDANTIGENLITVDEDSPMLASTKIWIASGVLFGMVTDDRGRAVQGANLQIEGENGVSLRARTTEGGSYRLANVPPGIYSVLVSFMTNADTKVKITGEVKIEIGKDQTKHDFVLR